MLLNLNCWEQIFELGVICHTGCKWGSRINPSSSLGFFSFWNVVKALSSRFILTQLLFVLNLLSHDPGIQVLIWVTHCRFLGHERCNWEASVWDTHLTHIFQSNIIAFHLVSITRCSEFSVSQVLIWETHFFKFMKGATRSLLCVWDTYF